MSFMPVGPDNKPLGTTTNPLVQSAESFDPLGAHGSLTGLSTVQTLTAPAGATQLQVQVFGADVYYRHDGGDPTPSGSVVPFRLFANETALVAVKAGQVLKLVQSAPTATAAYQWGS